MADVTLAAFDEMEPIYEGPAREPRWASRRGACSCSRCPPDWDGYPDHVHDATAEDANQEEVYIPLEGSAELRAGDERYELRPGVMVRVGPEQRRRILPGAQGIRFLALGGVPGTFSASPWTELGGPAPVPQ